MVKVKFFCAMRGVPDTFGVEIEDEKDVDTLKDKIKDKKSIACPVDEIKLFPAKTDGAWLKTSSNDVKKLMEGEMTALIKALTHENLMLGASSPLSDFLRGMETPKLREVHLLVVLPGRKVSGIRKRSTEWFTHSDGFKVKKRKVDDDVEERAEEGKRDDADDEIRYFDMTAMPPLAHREPECSKVLERKSYAVLFSEIMETVNKTLGAPTNRTANVVVTGNPGIGKRRRLKHP